MSMIRIPTTLLPYRTLSQYNNCCQISHKKQLIKQIHIKHQQCDQLFFLARGIRAIDSIKHKHKQHYKNNAMGELSAELCNL